MKDLAKRIKRQTNKELYTFQKITQNGLQTYVQLEIIKFLKDNIGEIPDDLGFGDDI